MCPIFPIAWYVMFNPFGSFPGKWFNYGIIFLVMIFDLNMWKNQIFYFPEYYGQYTGKQARLGKCYSAQRLKRVSLTSSNI